jgi:site-specific DNA recombinase
MSSVPRTAAIYARYSTDLQSDRSIIDQFELCRAYAQRERLAVILTYDDGAESGASVHTRPGLQRLIEDARDRKFDVLVVEAFDRLARRQADSHSIFDLFTFLGIELRAVHDGVADPVTFGLRAMVAQMQREDGAKKVRRGMAGVVRDGRHAGGRAYGYALVPGKPGELTIDENEAAVVREIFARYAAGEVPRQIAGDLNRRNVRPPRGARWNASTLNGNLHRNHGFLLNELYIGRIVWNKVRMVKDPETGKRVSRPNEKSEHQSKDVPHLRIIDAETWDAVQEIKRARGCVPAHKSRRPIRMLSGLVRCGTCGGGMVVHDHDHNGKIRLRCATQRESGSCRNTRRVYLEDVEQRVLNGLNELLQEKKYLAEYVREYNAERKRLASAKINQTSRLKRRSGEVARELERMIDAIAKGIIDPETLRERIKTLESERDAIKAELDSEIDTDVITLHSTAIERYRAHVDELRAALAKGTKHNLEVITPIRALVSSIIIHAHGPAAPYDIEIKGRLAALTRSQAFPQAVLRGLGPIPHIPQGWGGLAVAEEGLEPPTHGL